MQVLITFKPEAAVSASAASALVTAAGPASKVIPCVVTFDASRSTDPDGTITEFRWTFHDGTTAIGPIVQKTYTAVGSFTVGLRLTDDFGAASSFGYGAGTFVANQPPAAAAVVLPIGGAAPLTVVCDGSASRDPDGTIVSYAWSGGGQTASGATATLTLATPGTYDVALVVTDNSGATATKATAVTVTAADPTNVPPVADFTANGV